MVRPCKGQVFSVSFSFPYSLYQTKFPARDYGWWIIEHKFWINNLSIYLVPNSPWVVQRSFHLSRE